MAVLFAAILGLGAPNPADSPSRFEFRQTHMGSEFQVILYSADAPSARRASDAAFARIAALDLALSDYNPESELMRLCDRAGRGPIPVGDDLFRVLERSLEISRRTDGAFDVTVGPLVHLWRKSRREKKLPPADKLKEARSKVGYQFVTLNPKARTVSLAKAGMRLDLGGIAKGYASHEAIQALRREGISIALVAGAGDIAVSDPPPGEKGWTIGVGPLADPTSPPGRSILLKNASVSTSGDAERYVEIGGVRYSHIVDPRTGLGIVDRSSVTVISPEGALSDALDTAAYALGPERGLTLIEETPEAAALIVRSEDGKEKTYPSSRFAAYLKGK